MVTKRATELKIVGGDLALDLANTLEGTDAPETLVDYAELARWAALTGAITQDDAERLTPIASRDPDAADRVLADVRRLRAVVDGIFRAVAARERPAAGALDELAGLAAEAAARARLVPDEATFALAWEGDDLRRVVWPIAAAAVDLLRTGPLDRIKTCANCPWLFIDRSRNRSRRWCTMDECGVHLKMRRYRARQVKRSA
ncbi:MAG TPA: ABATE domain-containing protein [Solirubrobacteraceae bacterium]|nr:ABATE domain-containing protein [Solirubrobacteraceae bacterium]